MRLHITSDKLDKQLAEAMTWSNRRFSSLDEFQAELEKWYNQFQAADCTLGYAAEQLGLNKVDLIHILDWLGQPASNV